MNNEMYSSFVYILKSELVPALGCTEPIAIAFAAAKAKEVLGTAPTHLDVYCSGNIIKNVQGVVVPNSNGKKGIEIAAILGAVGGNSSDELEVLSKVNDEARAESEKIIRYRLLQMLFTKKISIIFISRLLLLPVLLRETQLLSFLEHILKLCTSKKMVRSY